FWLCVLVGVLGATWIWLVVPESEERTGGRVDYAGAALLTLTLATLLLPLSDGSTWGWSSPATLALAVALPGLAVVFVRHQTGRPAALVDIRTVRRRPILLTNIASVLVGFSLFANFLGTAPYVEAPVATGYGFGASTLVGGLYMVPGGLAMMLLSPVA